jgi:predicted O-methyltransferase YrrM
MLDDSQWSHKAWMSQVDADLLERILLRQARVSSAPLRVLEWGSGRSTLYFTELLRANRMVHHWLTLEYDEQYFSEALAPAITNRDNCRVVRPDSGDPPAPIAADGESYLTCVIFNRGKVLPFLAEREADRMVDLDDYVNYPVNLGDRYDVILVDGRKRRRCLEAAAGLMRPGGVVVLHDAYRPYYQCAWARYASQRMLGEILWIGSQEQTNFLQWIA